MACHFGKWEPPKHANYFNKFFLKKFFFKKANYKLYLYFIFQLRVPSLSISSGHSSQKPILPAIL